MVNVETEFPSPSGDYLILTAGRVGADSLDAVNGFPSPSGDYLI